MEASSECYMGGYFGQSPEPAQFSPMDATKNLHHFTVDDLLEFPQEDEAITDAFVASLTGNSPDSSTLSALDCSNSSVSASDASHFSTGVLFTGSELGVPYDDLAELEWLSNFVEESFSSDDFHNLHFIPTGNPSSATTPATATTDTSSSSITTLSNNENNLNSPPTFPSTVSVPGKARSKRSRPAPCDWSSRLLHLPSPATSSSENSHPINNCTNSDPSSMNPITCDHLEPAKTTPPSKRMVLSTDTQGRKCLHCGSETTPQWRTGPMGPKTLCNACGVRYKSGRLVPEYRPAASPTFVSAKHSNSHRKVMELRRQKEEAEAAGQQQLLSQSNAFFGVSNGGDDYLTHHQQTMNTVLISGT